MRHDHIPGDAVLELPLDLIAAAHRSSPVVVVTEGIGRRRRLYLALGSSWKSSPIGVLGLLACAIRCTSLASRPVAVQVAEPLVLGRICVLLGEASGPGSEVAMQPGFAWTCGAPSRDLQRRTQRDLCDWGQTSRRALANER